VKGVLNLNSDVALSSVMLIAARYIRGSYRMEMGEASNSLAPLLRNRARTFFPFFHEF
jgi:hypothetical protein